MAGKFNTESVSIAKGTARSIAVLPARAVLVAFAATLPGSAATIVAQNFIVFPHWTSFAAPVINALGFSILPG